MSWIIGPRVDPPAWKFGRQARGFWVEATCSACGTMYVRRRKDLNLSDNCMCVVRERLRKDNP